MQEFLTDVLESCDISTSLISPPVKVYTNVGIDHLKSTLRCWYVPLLPHPYCMQVEQPPVYGKLNLSFTDYMGPGVITRWRNSWYSLCQMPDMISGCTLCPFSSETYLKQLDTVGGKNSSWFPEMSKAEYSIVHAYCNDVESKVF